MSYFRQIKWIHRDPSSVIYIILNYFSFILIVLTRTTSTHLSCPLFFTLVVGFLSLYVSHFDKWCLRSSFVVLSEVIGVILRVSEGTFSTFLGVTFFLQFHFSIILLHSSTCFIPSFDFTVVLNLRMSLVTPRFDCVIYRLFVECTGRLDSPKGSDILIFFYGRFVMPSVVSVVHIVFRLEGWGCFSFLCKFCFLFFRVHLDLNRKYY